MRIAYTMAPGKGDTDLLLYRLAGQMQALGYRPCGTVQINTERARTGPCDMDVQVLPDGPRICISQNLGQHSTGCRLNPAALEQAVAHVTATLDSGADFLLVNKFGKHEAEGRGFCTTIARAVEMNLPVLVGLNGLSRDAFLRFSDGMAVELAPDLPTLSQWLETALDPARSAA